jgi:UDP-N-acetylmuramoyl-L-alanyl-D-glutamate--2,6-diaminopimelate ligase
LEDRTLRLGDLLIGLPGPLADVTVTGITADSRAVRPGFLFAALSGSKADGRAFIAQATTMGASVILGAEGIEAPIPVLISPDPRRELALIAAAFYGQQPETIVAVTGTSGKTSTAWFTQGIFAGSDHKAGYLGTLGLIAPGLEPRYTLTTPDPVALHTYLAEVAQAGVTHFALEASSHGIDQRRLDGVRLKAAAFTNLQRDHLDYHETMPAYFEAKTRLFEELLPQDGTAIVNMADEWGQVLRDRVVQRGQTSLTYGTKTADLALTGRSVAQGGQALSLSIMGQSADVLFPVLGSFQAENLLAALGLAIAAGVPVDAALQAIASLRPVPGRMETVGTFNGATVIVDYAHKPGALETVLAATRHTMAAMGKLHVIVGCGGDRDAGKRPIMGSIASRLADRAIITDDNPRSEDADTIRRAVLDGCDGTAEIVEIGDREEAIASGIQALKSGDVLIIAGKGHESGQIVGSETLPFDDREIAAAALAAAGGSVLWKAAL